jgi:hypothetical protein
MISLGKIMVFVFLLLSISQITAALGVVPGRTSINFEPGESQEITVRVLNNQNKDMNVLVSKEGLLADYVELDSDKISFKASEGEKFFTYHISMPPDIKTPGNNDVDISFVESPLIENEGETIVGGRPAVITQLRIKVPYPGRYAEADLQISVLDDKVTFTIPVHNLGSEELNVKTKIRISGPDGKELDSITPNEVRIRQGESDKIVGSWSAISVGTYSATIEVDYGGKLIEISKEFIVGDMFIRIMDISFDKFKLGDIAQMDILIQSGWNDVINEVYADVYVKNKEGNTISILKTASADIDSFTDDVLTAYWDTNGVKTGFYDVLIKLNYAGKWSEETFEIQIEENYIGKPGAQVKAGILQIAVIVGLIMIIGIIGIYIYKKKNTKEW